jgi:hypothetical protein
MEGVQEILTKDKDFYLNRRMSEDLGIDQIGVY